MIQRLDSNCGDESCPSCVVAGDFIFVGHHAGGLDSPDIVKQMESTFNSLKKTLATAGASLENMVQINLYLRNIEDFRLARDVFFNFFKNEFPTRMTITSDFVQASCLCMVDGIAYKKQEK